MSAMFPRLSVKLSSYRAFCVVAVCQSSGAFGVGFCPCAARRHLAGFPGLGQVVFFEVVNASLKVVPAPGGVGYVVEGCKPMEITKSENHA